MKTKTHFAFRVDIWAMTMRRPWVGLVSFVAALLVLALGHRWLVTASWRGYGKLYEANLAVYAGGGAALLNT